MTTHTAQHPTDAERIAALERQLAVSVAERAVIAEKLRDAELSLQRVREAYTKALEQLALQRRRVFVASAERREDEGAQLAAAWRHVRGSVRAVGPTHHRGRLARGDGRAGPQAL